MFVCLFDFDSLILLFYFIVALYMIGNYDRADTSGENLLKCSCQAVTIKKLRLISAYHKFALFLFLFVFCGSWGGDVGFFMVLCFGFVVISCLNSFH